MTALDTRYPELDLFLHRVRRRLNVRLVAGAALVGGLWGGVVALPIAFFLPPPLPRTMIWIAVAVLAAAVGALMRSFGRLSRVQAAAWLDEARGTFGLFAAATDALERPSEAFPDALILRNADRRRNDFGPRFPWKRLSARAVAAVVLAVAGGVVLSLPPLASPRAPPADEAASFAPERRLGSPAAPGGKTAEIPAREMARRLFPEDSRLAALAEQALASGDAGALDSLLNQTPGVAAEAGRARRSTDPGQSGGNTPGSPSLGLPQEPGSTPPSPGNGSKSGSGAPSKGSGSSPDPSKPDVPGSSSSSEGSDGSPSGSPGSNSGSGSGGGTPFGGSKGNPGTGHSRGNLVERGTTPLSDRKLVVPSQTAPGVFEYVVPESGARVPLSQALADTRRAAESALDRSSAPQEFENAVRDYFLSLSQEAQK